MNNELRFETAKAAHDYRNSRRRPALLNVVQYNDGSGFGVLPCHDCDVAVLDGIAARIGFGSTVSGRLIAVRT